jgi:hypothetical protein
MNFEDCIAYARGCLEQEFYDCYTDFYMPQYASDVIEKLAEWTEENDRYEAEEAPGVRAGLEETMDQRRKAIEDAGFDGRITLAIPSLGIRFEAGSATLGKDSELYPAPVSEYAGPRTKTLGVPVYELGGLLWDDQFNKDRKAKGVTWDELLEQGPDALEVFALTLAVPHAVVEMAKEYEEPEDLEALREMGCKL